MAQLDSKIVKEKILKFLEEKGPSLPVSIAKRVELNSIFTSAFLSELASEGRIKISHMKVGGSPLYFLPEKTQMLENFSSFLGNKEREAFELLKSAGYLQDDMQHPAIRVALRSLKDFAVPFKKEEKIFWKYFNVTEMPRIEVKEKPAAEEIAVGETTAEIAGKTEVKKEGAQDKLPENAVSRELEEIKLLKKELAERNKEIEAIRGKMGKKKSNEKNIKKPQIKKDETFLNEIKEHLMKKGMEIAGIESFDKKQAVIKARTEGRELLLFAYNRKKLEESEIIKAHKKASSLNMNYSILLKGGLPNKTKEAIEAYKNLSSVGNLAEQ